MGASRDGWDISMYGAAEGATGRSEQLGPGRVSHAEPRPGSFPVELRTGEVSIVALAPRWNQ